MPRLATDGPALVYDTVGSGDPLLFISGTSIGRVMWTAQVAYFAARYHCVCFDNRDVGESTIVTAPYTPREMAADTVALMRALDLAPAHVVGHSLGGAVAQELVLLAPQRVRTLTLVGTWACNDEHTRTLFHTWKRLRIELGTREFVEAMLLFAFGPTFLNALGRAALAEGYASALQQPPEAFCRQVDADLAHDTTARLGDIGVPTLVLAGADDAIFPAHHHRLLASRIPSATLVVLPEIGHTPPVEDIDAFNQALVTFLDAH